MRDSSDHLVLPPDGALDVLQARHRIFAAHYACLVTRGDEGKAEKRGTVTLVEYEGRRLLLTADHVARDHIGRQSTFLHYDTDAGGAPQLRALTFGRRVEFSPTLVCCSAELDVAFIEVPDEVSQLAGLRWFDLVVQRRVIDNHKEALAAPRTETTNAILPFIIFGFGNFSYMEDPDRRIQVFGGGPLLCELREWVEASSPSRPPQIWLEPYASADQAIVAALSPLEQTIVQRLTFWDDMTLDHAAFGGFSGGPVVWATLNADYLVATVKEGTRRTGAARVIATPITHAVELLESQQAGR
jgi:hypothetical protein